MPKKSMIVVIPPDMFDLSDQSSDLLKRVENAADNVLKTFRGKEFEYWNAGHDHMFGFPSKSNKFSISLYKSSRPLEYTLHADFIKKKNIEWNEVERLRKQKEEAFINIYERAKKEEVNIYTLQRSDFFDFVQDIDIHELSHPYVKLKDISSYIKLSRPVFGNFHNAVVTKEAFHEKQITEKRRDWAKRYETLIAKQDKESWFLLANYSY